jgi:hypothetical protein
MQSSVFAFIVIDVDGHFLDEAQRLAIGGLEALEIGPEDIVGFACGDALGKLAHVVGIEFPLGLLVFGAAYFHRDAVHRAVVGTPHGAGDKSVGLAFGLRGREETLLGTERRKEEDWKENAGTPPYNKLARARFRRSHRLRSPPSLLRLLPHNLLQQLSIQADW